MTKRSDVIPMQKGMVFYTAYSGNASLYLIQAIIHLSESVDESNMQLAWQTVLDRYDILKTHFKIIEKKCEQLIDKKTQLAFQFLDFSSDADPEQHFSSFAESDLNTGLDITKSPLFRLYLIKLAENNYKLIWTVHHSILDGSSICFIFKQVFAKYDALVNHQKIEIEEVSSYKEFVEKFNSEPFAPHAAFWQKILKDATHIDLGKKPGLFIGVRKRKFQISDKVQYKLNQLVKTHRVPLNNIVQCAWGVLLAKYSNKLDVIFGSVWALEQANVQKMLGLFINTLPTRIKFEENSSLVDAMKNLRVQHKEVKKHLFSSMVDIRELAEFSSNQDLFISVVDYKALSANDLVKHLYANWKNRYLDFKANNHQPLLLEIYHENQELFGALNYQISLFHEDEISQIIADYLAILEQIANNENIKFSEISTIGQQGVKGYSNFDIEKEAKKQVTVTARTKTEKSIAKIWQKLFNVKEIDVGSNFFEIGGYSLLAMAFLTEMENQFAIKITLSDLIHIQTIAALAKFVDSKRTKHEEKLDELINFQVDSSRLNESFPLTPIQKAYYIGRSSGLPLSVEPIAYLEWETETLDINQFELAFNQLIVRHPMLRGVAENENDQKILSSVPYYIISRDDFSEYSLEDMEKAVSHKRQEISSCIFDVKQWPLFYVSVTKADKYLIHFCLSLISIDASSIQLLVNEWSNLYNNLNYALPKLELSYRDYAIALMNVQQLPDYQTSEAYWQEKIKAMPLGPDLPLAKAPQMVQRANFQQFSAKIEQSIWQDITRKAKFAGITAATLLLTVFSLVLRKWSRRDELTVNVTLFNRILFHPDVKNLVGDFTSLEMLSFDKKQESFILYAKNIQSDLWSDLSNAYYTGIEVQQALTKIHNLRTENIFPVVFTSLLDVFNKDKAVDASNLFQKLRYSTGKTPQVWLDNRVYEEEGSLFIIWDHVAELFPKNMIQDMFNAYKEAIESLAFLPWTNPLEIKIPEYQIKLLAEVNQTNAQLPIQLLPELFINQVEKQGAKLAVISHNGSLSYHELFIKMTQLAHLLQKEKIQKNELVSIIMEKGWEQIVACLAITLVGGVYVPIDPDLPSERMDYLLKSSKIRIILTQNSLRDLLNKKIELEKYIYFYLDQKQMFNGLAQTPIKPVPQLHDLAYVIFTSGSTGVPKGVAISHQAAANTILDINKRFNVTEKDRVLALSNLSFDLSVYDIFGMLAAGGTIIMPEQAGLKDPAYWLELIAKHQVTLWNSAPMFMMMLCEYLAEETRNALESIRIIMLSGDKFPTPLAQKIYDHFKNTTLQLYSLGGATEASIWSIFTKVKKSWPPEKDILYGKPLTNQTWYVLDHQLNSRPLWVEGDLYIGGFGLAEGYWSDAEKTKKSFIYHPVLNIKLYKTGDLGRFQDNGNIEFLGRSDFQVKISGYRIELGEIEMQILQHPLADQVVVTTVKEEGKPDKLAAYIKIKNNYLLKELTGSDIIFEHVPIKKLSIANKKQITSKSPPLKLLEIKSPAEQNVDYFRRKSYRHFLPEKIQLNVIREILNLYYPINKTKNDFNFVNVSELLREISCVTNPNLAQPKRKYPSPSSLYAVHVYLRIKKSIEGLGQGYYYFDVEKNELVWLNDMSVSEKSDDNIEIYFVENKSAIEPIYGQLSRYLCLVEIGYMLDLLRSKGGNFSFDLIINNHDNLKQIKQKLKLKADEQFLCAAVVNKDRHDFFNFNDADLDLYIYLKPEFNYEAGLYLFKDNELRLINSNAKLTKFNFSLNNWAIFEEACIALLFVKNTPGKITEVNLIQSGVMAGHISNKAILKNIGFCPIGVLNPNISIELDPIQEPAQVVHILLGGYVTAEQINERELSKTPSIQEILNNEFKTFLAAKLPHHMLPNFYAFIENFKLSVTGKIDLKALPKIGISHKKEIVNPSNETENKILNIWKSILKIPHLSINDDFFELGGNSLQAIQLVNQIKNEVRIDFNLSQLLENPTIQLQSKVIRRLNKVEKKQILHAFPSIIPNQVERYHEFSLTNIQHAYLLGREKYFVLGNISTQGYNEWETEDLDLPKLEQALNKVINRNDTLRTVFTKNYTQVVLEDPPYYKILVDDVSHLTEAKQQSFVLNKRLELINTVLIPAQYPLFSISVTKLGNKYRIHLIIDLLIVDVTSFYMFLAEWLLYYQQKNIQLPELILTFRDYVLSLEKIKQSESYIKARDYWRARLDNLPLGPTLPLKTSPEKIENPVIKRCSGKINQKIWEKLHQKCRLAHVTPTTLLLTVFAYILQVRCKEPKFCLNLTTFERPQIHAQINEILGDFTSSILFEIDRTITNDDSFLNYLQIFQKRLIEDLDHSLFTGIEVQRFIKKKYRVPAEINLMPIVFTSALHIPEIGNATNNPFFTLAYSSTRTSGVSLDYTAYPYHGDLYINWDYVDELYPDKLIEELHKVYCETLSYLADMEWSNPLPNVAIKTAVVHGVLENALLDHEPFLHGETNKNKYVEPRTYMEELLVNNVQQILQIDKVGVYDNFFELGGDSLFAIKLIVRINSVFHTTITARDLYFAPVLSDFLRLIEKNVFENLTKEIIVQQCSVQPQHLMPSLAVTETTAITYKNIPDPVSNEFLEFWHDLEDLYIAAVCNALRKLGAYQFAGEEYSLNELIKKCEIGERFRKWLIRALYSLVVKNILVQDNEKYQSKQIMEVVSLDSLAQSIQEKQKYNPLYSKERVDLLIYIAQNLAEIISEKTCIATILSSDAIPGIYQTMFWHCNHIIRESIAALIKNTYKKNIRVLDMGAGFGTTTSAILGEFPADRTEYYFTDISKLFLQLAEKNFAQYKFLKTGILNMDLDPFGQGYKAGSFNMIIATNLIHNTKDVHKTVKYLYELLAPGGTLLVVEETIFHHAFNLGLGLQSGFDNFEDYSLRPIHPFLDREQWINLLAQYGFENSILLNFQNSINDYLGLDVFIARKLEAENIKIFLENNLSKELTDNLFAPQPLKKAAPLYKPIVRFNEEGANKPLILIHPGHAGAECYTEFSYLIGKEQPILALDSYNLHAHQKFLKTIPEIAEKYVSFLKEEKINEPYYLGGWSLGGLIAYEMAQQLLAEGKEIRRLYLMDSYLLGEKDKEYWKNNNYFVKDTIISEYFSHLSEEERLHLKNVYEAEANAVVQYNPKPYIQSALLFKAKLPQVFKSHNPEAQKFFERLHQNLVIKWQQLIKKIDIQYVDGDHKTIMEGKNLAIIVKTIIKDLKKM